MWRSKPFRFIFLLFGKRVSNGMGGIQQVTCTSVKAPLTLKDMFTFWSNCTFRCHLLQGYPCLIQHDKSKKHAVLVRTAWLNKSDSVGAKLAWLQSRPVSYWKRMVHYKVQNKTMKAPYSHAPQDLYNWSTLLNTVKRWCNPGVNMLLSQFFGTCCIIFGMSIYLQKNNENHKVKHQI